MEKTMEETMVYELTLRIDNTIEEFIIKNIQPYLNETITVNAKKIADAINRQTELKPKQDLRKGSECYCGKCGSYVGWKREKIGDLLNYCPDCGQKIDTTL